jgi:hypothetical protein
MASDYGSSCSGQQEQAKTGKRQAEGESWTCLALQAPHTRNSAVEAAVGAPKPSLQHLPRPTGLMERGAGD